MRHLSVCLNPTIQKTLRFAAVTPDSVNRTDVHRLDVSGKGINVSRVLRQLGKDVVHLTQLGGVLRPLFLSLCEQDSLAVEWVESNSPIRMCYTLLNDADSSVTELVEESEPVDDHTGGRLLEKFESLLDGCGSLIISGTKAKGFHDDIIPLMARMAKQRGLAVILDIRGKDLIDSLACKPDVIKPNLSEFVATFLPELADLQSADQSAGGSADEKLIKEQTSALMLELCEKYHCRIVLTRGADKVWAAEVGNFFETEFEAVKPLNTTGSGDAFTAGLASALGEGTGFAAAIAEGIRCGALNAQCLKPGVISE